MNFLRPPPTKKPGHVSRGSNSPSSSRRFKFPTAYTILFALIALVAAGSWVIPAGQYERIENAELGRSVPVPGTYETVDANPQGIFDVLLAPIAGFYNPETYEAQAIDVALFVIIIGGFLPFTMSINQQAVADGAIAVGDQIPAFRSVDEFGQVFDSATLHDHLLLIKFFRAHW